MAGFWPAAIADQLFRLEPGGLFEKLETLLVSFPGNTHPRELKQSSSRAQCFPGRQRTDGRQTLSGGIYGCSYLPSELRKSAAE